MLQLLGKYKKNATKTAFWETFCSELDPLIRGLAAYGLWREKKQTKKFANYWCHFQTVKVTASNIDY